MKTILFSADFTESTTLALDWAKLFARHYKATLVLLHVQQIPMANTTLPMSGDVGMGAYNAGLTAELEPIDRERLDKLATQLRAEGLTCETELRWGAVTDAIVTAADDLHADLIITGRSHLGNFFERFVGTEATGVARRAHCPVLVVPTTGTGVARLRTILFSTPLEFDQPAEFTQVVAMARAFGATLSVLHIHAENQPSIADKPTMIAQLQALYGDQPLAVSSLDSRTVTGGFETYLKTNQPDLLVMTNRERDFLSGLLNPSLTERMVVLTDIPILVYHAQGDL
ncbi:MAG: universal stress protein [Bacteroidetes bacterium]|nr:universal stress protein [Fibrella sp.]